MTKKILCKSCQSHIGEDENDQMKFSQMKSLSKMVVDFKNKVLHVLCHFCHNWNSFENDIQTINYKLKASEHLNFKR